MNKSNFSKIKKLLKFVYTNHYSDFYKERFKKAGFNPLSDFKSIKDMKKIPLLSKTDLLKVDLSKLLFINEKEIAYIRSTSGTTGKPLYIFHSKQDIMEKWLANIDFGRVLILSNPNNVDFVSLITRSSGSWSLNGDLHNLPASVKMAAEFQVNTIYTTPTLAIILSDYLKDYPILKKSLKYLYLFGELVNTGKKKFLQKLYPGTIIVLSYGSTETSNIGSQCAYLAKREGEIYYHPRFDFQYIEIINPDTKEEVMAGEKGEIVITNPHFLGTPIIRYKTGDLVSIKEGKNCPCGFPGPLLQIWGRANSNTLKAGGFELRSKFLEETIENSKGFLRDGFEIHVYENFADNKPKIRIEIKLSLKEGIKESLILKQKIINELLKNWQISTKLKLGKAIEMGFFEPIKINFVNFPTSVKTKRVLTLHQL